MWVLPGLRGVNAEVWGLPERDLIVVAGALARARWARARTLRQHLELYGSVLPSARLLTQLCSPAMLLAVLEDLVRENVLRRDKVVPIEEQMFQQLDREGRWRGDPQRYGSPPQFLPPDIEGFATIGAQ